MEIEELPDLKVNWIESYKYLAEPLLEYVWEVANHFLPDYEDVSAAPAPLPMIRVVLTVMSPSIVWPKPIF